MSEQTATSLEQEAHHVFELVDALESGRPRRDAHGRRAGRRRNQPPLDTRPRALEAYFAPAEGTRSPTRDRSSSISMQPPGTKWA